MDYLPVSEVATPVDETGISSIQEVGWLRCNHITMSKMAWVMIEKAGVISYLGFQKVYRWVKTKAS
jgi:hypothetical protein